MGRETGPGIGSRLSFSKTLTGSYVVTFPEGETARGITVSVVGTVLDSGAVSSNIDFL